MELPEMPNEDTSNEPRPWYRYIDLFDGSVQVSQPGTRRLDSSNRLCSSNGRAEREIVATTTGERCYSGTAEAPSFVVMKTRSTGQIHLQAFSPTLSFQMISVGVNPMSAGISLRDVVQGYLLLKERCSGTRPNAEIQLLVHDFLLSPRMYDGVNTLSLFSGAGLGGAELEKDLQAKRVAAGLDKLDFIFVLGQAREPSPNPEYIITFHRLLDKVVKSCDIEGLRRLCEPLVTKGKIDWRHDDDFLLQVLREGNLDVFRYVLDLAMRTQPPTQVALGYPDCSLDPLYTAIRLGRLETVQQLLDRRETFEGFCRVESSEPQSGSISFNPVTAAAYWGQQDILRILLGRGLASQDSIQAALGIASRRGHQGVIQELQRSSYIGQEQPAFEHGPDFLGILQQTPSISEPMGMPASLLHSAELSWDTMSTQGPIIGTASTEATSQHGPSPALLPSLTTNFSRAQGDTIAPNLQESVSHEFAAQLSSALQEVSLKVRSRSFQIGYRDLAEEYRGFGQVWERGVSTIRLITLGKTPSVLRDVLDCLLLTWAILKVKYGKMTVASQNFLGDLDCWKCAVPESEKPTFDLIAQSVWGFSSESDSDWNQDTHETVQTFSSLADKLLAASRISSSEGLPVFGNESLSNVFHNHNQNVHFPSGIFQDSSAEDMKQFRAHSTRRSLPQIPAVAQWGNYSQSFPGNHVDSHGLLALSTSGYDLNQPPEITISARESLPVARKLLSSVALGVVFSMFIILQGGAETPETRLIGQQRYSLASTCAILSKFTSMLSGSASLPQSQLPTIVTPPSDYLSVPDLGGLTPSTAVSSECPTPSPVTVPLDATAFSNFPSPMSGTLSPLIPPLSPGFISPEPGCSSRGRSPSNASMRSDISGNSPPDGDGSSRPRSDPCENCGRTFSSVTNLRKHLRDKVCMPGSKSRFPCRNAGCERRLSTRWYRQQHEEQYCQFRRPQGVAGE